MTAGLRINSYEVGKRLVDLLISGPVLVGSLPFQALLALLIWRNMGRPVFFRQSRPGKDGQVFTMVKFRTMRDVDPRRGLISDAERLTRLGRILRATSLDELPTLANVVKGDMSLVGPRPLLVEYLDRYTPEQARRHEVRPGITGLAQISGRNAISWEEKLRLDVKYVDERSFLLDLKVLARTATVVFSRRGVSSSGHVTMAKFQGNRQGSA